MPFVSTNGVETYYESRGDGNDQSIVFVHGATSDHQLRTQQVDALRDEYHVVTYDVRDHGKTGSSPTEYTVAELGDDLHALVDELELDRPVACGLSLGGMFAQRHAVDHPGDAAGYVFADTYTPETFSLTERVLMRTVSYGYLKAAELLGYNRSREALDRLLELLVGDESSPDEADVDALRGYEPELTDDEAIRIMRAARSWTRSEIDLTRIDVPVLALFGEHEADFVRAHVGQMSADVADFRAYELPDAGHNAHVEAPEAFVARLREFTEQSVPPTVTP